MSWAAYNGAGAYQPLAFQNKMTEPARATSIVSINKQGKRNPFSHYLSYLCPVAGRDSTPGARGKVQPARLRLAWVARCGSAVPPK